MVPSVGFRTKLVFWSDGPNEGPNAWKLKPTGPPAQFSTTIVV